MFLYLEMDVFPFLVVFSPFIQKVGTFESGYDCKKFILYYYYF